MSWAFIIELGKKWLKKQRQIVANWVYMLTNDWGYQNRIGTDTPHCNWFDKPLLCFLLSTCVCRQIFCVVFSFGLYAFPRVHVLLWQSGSVCLNVVFLFETRRPFPDSFSLIPSTSSEAFISPSALVTCYQCRHHLSGVRRWLHITLFFVVF